MKNLIYILFFLCCNALWNKALAQQDTIKRIKIISASAAQKDTVPNKVTTPAATTPTVVTPTPQPSTESITNQLLVKEIESLRKEISVLKETKKVVVVQRPEAPKESALLHTIVSLNMLTMVSRLVPFGNGIPLAGPTSVMLRRYRDNRAFRMGLGLNASPDANQLNATIRIGTERKKELNSKFTFTRGVDFMLASGSFTTPGFSFTDVESGAIGAALTFGIEYNINPNITLGTESLIFGGIAAESDNGFSLKIIPPIALYLSAKLY